jgi:hypothetical protein
VISKWLSANEVAELLGISIRWVQKQAGIEHRVFRNQKGNGGVQLLYRLDALPRDGLYGFFRQKKL